MIIKEKDDVHFEGKCVYMIDRERESTSSSGHLLNGLDLVENSTKKNLIKEHHHSKVRTRERSNQRLCV